MSIMWWDPTPDSFVASSGGILLGTGSLAHQKVAIFQKMEHELQNRVVAYRETPERPPPTHALDLIAVIATVLSNALIRLSSLKTSHTQMCFTVTEFQRYYLELVGLLDYMEIYQPRMRGWSPAATTISHCVGVFTLNETVVQDFHWAGLPVWYLCPWSGGPFNSNVLELVEAIPCNARMDDYDPPFPTIFTGILGGREVVDAIHHFSRNWLSYKDPFLCRPVQIDPQPSSSSSSPSLSSLAAVGKSKGPQPNLPLKGKPKIVGRNKYDPLDGPLVPFPIPAWAHGLRVVDTSYSNLIEHTKSQPHFGHYVFPDPALIATPKLDGKKAMLLRTWLLCRDAWLACVASRESLAIPIQGWRDILFLDFTTTPTVTTSSNTKTGIRLAETLAKFKPETLEAFRVDPQYATGQPMRWNGNSYPLDQLPPQNIVREILWELYELNFMYELQSLNRRACLGLDINDSTALYEREMIIRQCFPFLAYKQPAQVLPTRNQGLASDNPSERMEHVLQLAKLMSSWQGEIPPIFKLHERKSQDSIARKQASDLEREVARFYCQTFYNYFGRAAQIPHRLYYVQ